MQSPDPETVIPAPELAAFIASEARPALLALELYVGDLQLHPLGPAAASEAARIRGLLLTLQAAADALPALNLEL
jgi:hypothetical protein